MGGPTMKAEIDRVRAQRTTSVYPPPSQIPPQKTNNHKPRNMSPIDIESDRDKKINDASAIDIDSDEYKKQFLHEATKLAIESVEKGWGGLFGAVIVRNGKIIGRGQNRVLLTGIPVYHAEVTAIIDACSRINSKALLGSDYYEGNLKMIPRSAGSPDPVPERAQMLKGCDLFVNGAPCPMCMSAIYWARIDRVYFGTRLEDTSKIGFDGEFQYIDFRPPLEGA